MGRPSAALLATKLTSKAGLVVRRKTGYQDAKTAPGDPHGFFGRLWALAVFSREEFKAIRGDYYCSGPQRGEGAFRRRAGPLAQPTCALDAGIRRYDNSSAPHRAEAIALPIDRVYADRPVGSSVAKHTPQEIQMIHFRKAVQAALLTLALTAALAACQKEGPAERAGKEVDEATKSVGRQIEKAGESIQDAAKGDQK